MRITDRNCFDLPSILGAYSTSSVSLEGHATALRTLAEILSAHGDACFDISISSQHDPSPYPNRLCRISYVARTAPGVRFWVDEGGLWVEAGTEGLEQLAGSIANLANVEPAGVGSIRPHIHLSPGSIEWIDEHSIEVILGLIPD